MIAVVAAAAAHVVQVELDAEPLLAALAALLAVVNLFVAVFNVVPALPLEGGRVLHAAVWALTGRETTGMRFAEAAGRGLAGSQRRPATPPSALWLAVLALSPQGA